MDRLADPPDSRTASAGRAMTHKIQALVDEMHQAAIHMGQSGSTPIGYRVQQWADRLAVALVQQAQLLEEQEQELTRVDEQPVMPAERATAAENEPMPEHRWMFYANGTFCTRCGCAIGSGYPCR